MLIATLGIGTELTTGQIIDRNSSWISKNLKELGVPTSCHLVVPDDRALILDALRFLSERCDTLFVTGGLGPTTDDFTRDLISEWSKKPLIFDEASWLHVNQRLSSRGIQIRDSQRQQCYFPQGAKVLLNPEGTANAFQMKVDNKDVFVLPGPPSEIAAVWRESIDAYLREKTKDLDKYVTYSWDTMGLGESDVAHITELCLDGIEIEKGYRVHLPYVEVKVSFLESKKEVMLKAVERLNEALRDFTVTRNGEDVPQLMVEKLTTVSKIEVVDSLTGQVLIQRLMPTLKSYMSDKSWSFSSHNGGTADSQTLRMVLKAWDSQSAIAEIHYKGASFKTIFEVPFMISKMSERKALYFTERALIFWLQKLGDLI